MSVTPVLGGGGGGGGGGDIGTRNFRKHFFTK